MTEPEPVKANCPRAAFEEPLQHDRQFRIEGRWALASDGTQWVVQRRAGAKWHALSFVRSSKDVLARCLREKGCEGVIADKLLAGLPDTFDAWKCHDTSGTAARCGSGHDEEDPYRYFDGAKFKEDE